MGGDDLGLALVDVVVLEVPRRVEPDVLVDPEVPPSARARMFSGVGPSFSISWDSSHLVSRSCHASSAWRLCLSMMKFTTARFSGSLEFASAVESFSLISSILSSYHLTSVLILSRTP
ncbi:hypothetical protein A6A08_20435 [Nocardiopsis sp. TSRI0078]|nr:hypothetical protein A6A08_20435 [Nocardiopsis sp. TSRI0078]